MVIERRGDQLYIGPLKPEQAPAGLVVARQMSDVKPLLEDLRPKFKERKL
jgi:hypothetical protein